jgi:hypothetical protein
MLNVLIIKGGESVNDHFLVDKTVIYEKNELKDPNNSTYDDKLGLWLWGLNKDVLVKSNNSDCPKRGTKKCDIETGEDQKGE